MDDVLASVTVLTAQRAHEKGLEFLAYVSSDIPQQFARRSAAAGAVPHNLVNNAVKLPRPARSA